MAEGISASSIMSQLEGRLANVGRVVEHGETAIVSEVGDGIARIPGLKDAMS